MYVVASQTNELLHKRMKEVKAMCKGQKEAISIVPGLRDWQVQLVEVREREGGGGRDGFDGDEERGRDMR